MDRKSIRTRIIYTSYNFSRKYNVKKYRNHLNENAIKQLQVRSFNIFYLNYNLRDFRHLCYTLRDLHRLIFLL